MDLYHLSKTCEETIKLPIDKDLLCHLNIRWLRVSLYRYLSNDFIMTFRHRLNWEHMSMTQRLPVDFIEMYYHRVHWPSIFAAQDIPDDMKCNYHHIYYRQLGCIELSNENNNKMRCSKCVINGDIGDTIVHKTYKEPLMYQGCGDVIVLRNFIFCIQCKSVLLQN